MMTININITMIHFAIDKTHHAKEDLGSETKLRKAAARKKESLGSQTKPVQHSEPYTQELTSN